MGADPFSLDGAVALGWVHPIGIGMFVLFPVGLGAVAIAGERQRGTLEVLLSRPLSRRTLFATHLLTLVLIAVLTTLAALAGTVCRGGGVRGGGRARRGRTGVPRPQHRGAARGARGHLARGIGVVRPACRAGGHRHRGAAPGLRAGDPGHALARRGVPPAALAVPLPVAARDPGRATASPSDIAVLAGIAVVATAYGLWRFPRRDLAAPDWASRRTPRPGLTLTLRQGLRWRHDEPRTLPVGAVARMAGSRCARCTTTTRSGCCARPVAPRPATAGTRTRSRAAAADPVLPGARVRPGPDRGRPGGSRCRPSSTCAGSTRCCRADRAAATAQRRRRPRDGGTPVDIPLTPEERSRSSAPSAGGHAAEARSAGATPTRPIAGPARYTEDWSQGRARPRCVLADHGRGPAADRHRRWTAEAHRRQIDGAFYPCSYEMHVGWPRCTSPTRGSPPPMRRSPPGCAVLHDAIVANAARHGG